jgi:hypothetical protein
MGEGYTYPPTEVIDEYAASFPPVPTPELSYSPSSTDSSSGDRTIQMATFLDDSTLSNATVHTGSDGTWLELPSGTSIRVSPESSFDSISPAFGMKSWRFHGNLGYVAKGYPQTLSCQSEVYGHSTNLGAYGMQGYPYLSEWEGQIGRLVC